jgi:thioredoxin-related protein
MMVILDEKGRVIQTIGGYRRAAEFEKMIAYFATNAHQNTPWASFEKTYKR